MSPPTGFSLDSHSLIWTSEGPTFPGYRLSDSAIDAIGNAREALVSEASLWEIAIKSSLPGSRGLKLALPYGLWIDRLAGRRAYARLATLDAHLKRVAILPPHHGDPFDQLLVAQCLVEGVPIVSADAALDAYGVERIW